MKYFSEVTSMEDLNKKRIELLAEINKEYNEKKKEFVGKNEFKKIIAYTLDDVQDSKIVPIITIPINSKYGEKNIIDIGVDSKVTI